MSLIDLHIHSTNSDGELSVEQIEQLSIEKKLEVVSFTDHNYINRYKSDKVRIIKGIELDCEFERNKMHVLLYNFINDEFLSKKIDELSKEKLLMVRKLLKNINHYYGIHIDNTNGFIKNKRDIIKWLMNNGYGNNPDELADMYTSRKSKCYVPTSNLTFEQLAPFIGEKTIVSLAHPDSVSGDSNYLDELIKKLKKYGLNALEVINLKHHVLSYNELLLLAHKNNLICTFGSDFHKKEDKIGVECENEYIRKLLK